MQERTHTISSGWICLLAFAVVALVVIIFCYAMNSAKEEIARDEKMINQYYEKWYSNCLVSGFTEKQCQVILEAVI